MKKFPTHPTPSPITNPQSPLDVLRFTFHVSRFAIAIVLFLAIIQTSTAAAGLSRISQDPYTNTTSQHRTQVEPDTYAYGNTIVAAFQSGRFGNGGASNIGWATSSNGGTMWTYGFLPKTTTFAGGSLQRISDPSVVYDAKHSSWIILALGITNAGQTAVTSGSTNGGTAWNNPVTLGGPNGGYDKTWITCDNSASSPYYGNCYALWDNAGANGILDLSISSDGGASWTTVTTIANTSGLGVQPVTQPNGTVIVPYFGFDDTMYAVRSTDGGATWNQPQPIAAVSDHPPQGNLRAEPLPSADVDSTGQVYLVWQACNFIKKCAANDIVFSTSTDGLSWTQVKRIRLDPKKLGVDHFIPGIAVDPATSGSTAHLALTYYYYEQANCTITTCRLGVAYAGSTNGGATWSHPTQLTALMSVQDLPNTSLGYMVGDYISTSIIAGKAIPVFAYARPPKQKFRQAMYVPTTALPISGGTLKATTPRTLSPHSTHPARGIHTLP